MTRDEAINELKCAIDLTHFNPLTGEISEWLNDDNQRFVDACDMAIKALEQEPILDKIKADIFNACSDNYHMPVNSLICDQIFEIIDQYRAESEVEK